MNQIKIIYFYKPKIIHIYKF